MLIDFHTHQRIDDAVGAVVNLPLPWRIETAPGRFRRYSAGIHPWELANCSEPHITELLAALEKLLAGGKVAAVGECGLDRAADANLTRQLALSEAQIQLAEKYSLPIIIHCVRAYDEMTALVKKYAEIPAWIFHGYSGSQVQLQRLLQYDNCYISFGPVICRKSNKHCALLKMVPCRSLLLESDDSETDIAAVYRCAAEIIGIEVQALADNMKKNFSVLFS